MRLSFCLTVLLILCGSANAQRLSVTVSTCDAHEPITGALTELWNDTVRVAFGVTDRSGTVSFKQAPTGKCRLSIRALGYEKGEIYLTEGENKGTVTACLKPKPIEIGEVKVTAFKSGIGYRTDTVRYNPKVYTDGNESTLGDVLKKLPGIEVDPNGNIRAQGKEVSNVMLNGHTFFEGNTQMATKNLSADLAQSVEVLHNYSEYSLLQGFQTQEKTVINIGVGSDKLGRISGNLSLGGGIQDKYNGRGDVMRLGSRSMLYAVAAGNNTGQSLFSTEDFIRKRGGAAELLSDGGSFEVSAEDAELLKPQNNVFKRQNVLTAVNLAAQPASSLKLSADLLVNSSDSRSEDLLRYSFGASDQRVTNSLRRMINGTLKVGYNPDLATVLSYRGAVASYYIKNDNTVSSENAGVSSNLDDLKKTYSTRFDNNLSLLKSYGANLWVTTAKATISRAPERYQLNAQDWQYQPSSDNLQQLSFSTAWLNRIQDGYFLRFLLANEYGSDSYNSRRHTSETSVTTRSLNTESGIDVVKNLGLVRFKLGGRIHRYDFTGQSPFWRLTPTADIALQMSDRHKLSLSWTHSYSSLAASLYAQDTVYEAYNYYTKASLLTNVVKSESALNISYLLVNLFYRFTLIGQASYRNVGGASTLDLKQQGAVTVGQRVNSPVDNESMNVNLYCNKGVGMLPIELTSEAQYTVDKSANLLNGVVNKAVSQTASGKMGARSNYRKALNFEVSAQLQQTRFNPDLAAAVKQQVLDLRAKVKFTLSKYIYMEGELQHRDNRIESFNEPQYLLNGMIRYRSSDHKTELALSGNNMLHLQRQQWASVSYINGYFAERYFNQIPGYLILSYTYKF